MNINILNNEIFLNFNFLTFEIYFNIIKNFNTVILLIYLSSN